MNIRPACEDDIEWITALECDTFSATTRWNARLWREELEPALRSVLVAFTDQPQGVASFREVGGQAELNRIIVAPQARRTGVASALMRAGLDWAAGRGADTMLLEVACENAAAIKLYRGFGFRDITTRADYYGPGQDAIIMEASWNR